MCGFELIPAIDLKGGRCVRLKQGRMEDETVYGEDPAAMARRWEKAGAPRLHVVDLDGAVAGRPENRKAIAAIVKAVSIPVQLGGGLRTLASMEEALALGVDRIVLGSVAVQNPKLVAEACRRFPGRVLAGLDAKHGRVAVHGWQETTPLSVVEAAVRLRDVGVDTVIYTDIARDGMLSGPDLKGAKALARQAGVKVILSGGIRDLEDVRRAAQAFSDGVVGAITGRAIYEGTLRLEEAYRVLAAC